MHLLWITIVLALFQCNAAQEESSTVNQDLIDELFTKDDAVQNKAGNLPDNAKVPDTPVVADDPAQDTTKKPNVS